MRAREIGRGVKWLGAIDWDRRLFDSLIPLPDGTSYNAYLIQGSEKTALLDTVDETMTETLLAQLAGVTQIDYLIVHHVEQDHAGSVPAVLARYPGARVLCSPKAKEMLVDHLLLDPARIDTVADGEKLSLGDRTLEFVHIPWVHWPETMGTWLADEGILFTCDLFGSHLATSSLYITDKARTYEAAKRYYAEIMMPFRKLIQKHLQRIEKMPVRLLAPSHGPIHHEPNWIMDAYRDWTSDLPKDEVVLPYISMHGSTKRMVDHLVSALTDRDVTVHRFDLTAVDLGKLAIALVDAGTIILGTPTVHVGPHPNVFMATHLANALRPKLKFASVINSYGWGTKAVEKIAELIPNLNVQILEPVVTKGFPKEEDLAALDALADKVVEQHKAAGIRS